MRISHMPKQEQRTADWQIHAKSLPSEQEIPPDYRPSDDEPFMNPRQIAYFRNRLTNWKVEILVQNSRTLHNLRKQNDYRADMVDRANNEFNRNLELRTRDRQRKLVEKIDAALQRIAQGEYGYCIETGKPIDLRRLAARPIALLSIEAQERHEQSERIYRKE